MEHLVPPTDPLERLEQELRRVVERLRLLAVERLAQPAPPWPSRAAAVRETAQLLADVAQDVEAVTWGVPAGRRPLPELGDYAVADQLAVTGADLLRALRQVGSAGAEGAAAGAAGADLLDRGGGGAVGGVAAGAGAAGADLLDRGGGGAAAEALRRGLAALAALRRAV